jgi:hypothetical protein
MLYGMARSRWGYRECTILKLNSLVAIFDNGYGRRRAVNTADKIGPGLLTNCAGMGSFAGTEIKHATCRNTSQRVQGGMGAVATRQNTWMRRRGTWLQIRRETALL